MMIGALWVRFSAAVLCCLCLICGSLRAHGGELLVSSAVSLKEVVEVAGRHFQSDRSGLLLRYNFGASGELRQQIEGGAPVDVFLSAGQSEMDALERKGFLFTGSRRILARNSLVVIVPVGSAHKPVSTARSSPARGRSPGYREPEDRSGRSIRGRVPEDAQPLGGAPASPRSGRERATGAGICGAGRGGCRCRVRDRHRGARERVREALRPPPDSHRPIVYPAAVVAESGAPQVAGAFVGFLVAPEDQAILARRGFLVTSPAR